MDILTPVDVPQIIQSFFALEGVNCHDGHTKPLLGVQVTELLDGIFVGCSFNHVIGDGTSFWKLFNALAETNRKLRKASKEAVDQHIECSISSLPITKRWFMEDPTLINLPFSHHKEFIERYERPLLRERMFHFTEESLAKLKAKSNEECGIKKYFCGTTTVGELLEHGIGWEAMLLHEAVEEYTDEKIRVSREEWMKKPYILQMGPSLDAASVMMGGSPKFDVYGCDFGLGMAVAARSGSANKFDGKVTAYRGLTGIRSVMLEICLPPQSISALESDAEFMDAVSPHETHSEVLGVNNVQDDPSKPEWILICMYGSPYPNQKERQWTYIKDLSRTIQYPWVIIGDLNMVFPNESRQSIGSTSSHTSYSNTSSRDSYCIDLIHEAGLEDMGYTGDPLHGLQIYMVLV
ncbi:protein ENHANCED PSEUDOMONAS SUSCEPTIBILTY 1-like [Papaver somniferum]|uniref:protein ENHANCED PSEUDOMONAS SUSCEPTIBILTY 1-like n=1 Tax=Papaver somniferum TaxID=3469 RepID=UPI000E700D62|nr:protein ENHANCED PSEUDOMONAS SUSCEPTIBILTY 1-like [Papaver somniferum]